MQAPPLPWLTERGKKRGGREKDQDMKGEHQNQLLLGKWGGGGGGGGGWWSLQ